MEPFFLVFLLKPHPQKIWYHRSWIQLSFSVFVVWKWGFWRLKGPRLERSPDQHETAISQPRENTIEKKRKIRGKMFKSDKSGFHFISKMPAQLGWSGGVPRSRTQPVTFQIVIYMTTQKEEQKTYLRLTYMIYLSYNLFCIIHSELWNKNLNKQTNEPDLFLQLI